MQPRIAILLLTSAISALATPPAEDRRAILSMAGNYKVTFDFKETVAIAPDYHSASPIYHEEAHEAVIVVEDTPARITLQHILVTGGSDGAKPRIIKHWAQVWTWEDTRILDYAGSEGVDKWQRHEVSPETASGNWSELVTSTDDTPRYESLGRWIHTNGESTWTSQPTRRPLPRREYEHRDDYDYLTVVNRYSLTPSGWTHFQDNRKMVDRDGKIFVLSHETGLNQYIRSDDSRIERAVVWWDARADTWNQIRNFWIDAGQQVGPIFAYRTTHGGVGISRKFAELEKSQSAAQTITEQLAPYLITNN